VVGGHRQWEPELTQACDRFLPPDLPAERVAARIGLVSDTHSQFTESLMTPDLELIWKELHQVGQSLDEHMRAKLRTGMLRILERCWLGEQQLISRTDLRDEIQRTELPVDMRKRIKALLAELP
jgi:hypothetical protein